MNEALVLLVLLWAVLLIPAALRSRNSSPHATVGGFERAMDVLRNESRDPGEGRPLHVSGDAAGRVVGRDLDPTKPTAGRSSGDLLIARRRRSFVGGLAATGVSLLFAVVFGGWLWAPAVLALLGTAGYAALLRHLKLQRDRARRAVARLDLPDGGGPDPTPGDARLSKVAGDEWPRRRDV